MSKSGHKLVSRIFLILSLVSVTMSCEMEGNKARYDNYRLVRLHLDSEEHVGLFQELEEQSDSFTFYGHALKAPQDLTILVAAHK